MNESRGDTWADLANGIREFLTNVAEAVRSFLKECEAAMRKLHEAIYEAAVHIEEAQQVSRTAGYLKLMQAKGNGKVIRANTKPLHLKALYRRRTP